MYATMVNLVTGLPCAGLGLCHIGTPFIKNEYGMPKRNIKGMYIIDEKEVKQLSGILLNFIIMNVCKFLMIIN